jgi:signal transduction histidine kinase
MPLAFAWWNTQSLRWRLLARVAVTLLIVFTVAAGCLYALMRASLLAELDGSILGQATAIASLTEQDSHRIKMELEPGELPEFAVGRRPNYMQLWENGKSIYKSPSLGDRELKPPAEIPDKPTAFFITLPNGKSGRQIVYRFKPRFEDEKDKTRGIPARTAILMIARPTRDLQNTLERLAWALLSVSVGTIAASVVIMGLVIHRGLRPLGTLAASIERVGAHDLSERIHVSGTPTELAPVVQRLNDLLARLESALDREKSFTADVAHELRTPLAGLETMLEVCASRRREPDAYAVVIAKCLCVSQGMHAMVNNLLLLARADASQLTVESQAVELQPLLQECWANVDPRAIARNLHVQWAVEIEDSIATDLQKLLIIVNNLFDNAVTYTDDGGRIHIAARIEQGHPVLTVSNTGSRVSPADASKLFDRFWRGDVARGDIGTHCGLGLSLCRKMADVLGGTLAAESVDGTFTVTLKLPDTSSVIPHPIRKSLAAIA